MDKLYILFLKHFSVVIEKIVPHVRQFIRFVALPYCYFKLIDWKECPVNRFQVVKDLLYIFFRLKSFPDNYSPCRLWEKNRKEWINYYGSIYNPYQRGRLRKVVQRKEYSIVFDDKNICYYLCKAHDFPVPLQHGVITPSEDYKSIIKSIFDVSPEKRLIIKPVNGRGGSAISTVHYDKDIIIQGNGKKETISKFSLKYDSVIQEFIEQHSILSKVSPSTNTIRIVTLFTKDSNVLIVGAVLRFGIGNSSIDNVSSGGIAVGIDIKNGVLKGDAYDQKGRTYVSHPTSDIKFDNFKIPYWPEIVQLAQKIQDAFSFYKLLGSDIAITKNGPIIIEINAAHDNVGLEQKCGPILANEQVRAEFRKYDLLINRFV